jgi:C4-dicarboxylate-binding protein DctP
MKEATVYADKIAQEENDKALDAVKKSGKTIIYVPTDAEKAEWRKALLPVQKAMEGRIGKDLIDAVNKTVAAK